MIGWGGEGFKGPVGRAAGGQCAPASPRPLPSPSPRPRPLPTTPSLLQASYIIGYVVLGVLLASILAAAIAILSACCGCGGCGLATFAVPWGLVVLGTFLAYYFIITNDVNTYVHGWAGGEREGGVEGWRIFEAGRHLVARPGPSVPPTPTPLPTADPPPSTLPPSHSAYPVIEKKNKVVQVPNWGWYLGLISGALWLLAGSIGCCLPARTKKVVTLA